MSATYAPSIVKSLWEEINNMSNGYHLNEESLRRLRIAGRIAEEFKRLDGIDSIVVGGSTALGNAHTDSDIDMWISYSQLPDAEERQRIVDKLIKEYGSEPQPGFVTTATALDGTRIDPPPTNGMRLEGIDIFIILGSNNQFLQIPDNLERDMGKNEAGRSDFQSCIVLHDKRGIWKDIKDRLSYPTQLGKKVIKSNLEKLLRVVTDHMQVAIERNNHIWFLQEQASGLEAFLRVLFALNEVYFRTFKDIEFILPHLNITPNDCRARLGGYAKERDPEKARQILWSLTRELVTLIRHHHPDIRVEEKAQRP